MAKKKTATKEPSDAKYSFQLTDFDKYLIGEGTHERAYEKLGAHLAEIEGQKGVHFAVWAPSAREVYIMG
jgi:1,4-alpha-glucan branching enzyme